MTFFPFDVTHSDQLYILQFSIPICLLQALERNPAVCHALKETTDWEVASHGYRWIDYRNVDEETEREHIERTIKIHEKLLGKRPVGMYQGKVNTEVKVDSIRARAALSQNNCFLAHIKYPQISN